MAVHTEQVCKCNPSSLLVEIHNLTYHIYQFPTQRNKFGIPWSYTFSVLAIIFNSRRIKEYTHINIKPYRYLFQV